VLTIWPRGRNALSGRAPAHRSGDGRG
jgi:hypothetical protein